jgi:KaiC/GvpD/RAD55 family RecA-like ATPase
VGRVPTGTAELDDLLEGGIPKKYAVVLASPSCDEIQLLIERFFEAGTKASETMIYITSETGNVENLLKEFPKRLSLIICNPQADLIVRDNPNVVKLRGIENLTDIDIALTKYFRTLAPSDISPRRACVDLLSDVLLHHHATITRKWVSSLLVILKSQGFTTLAVMNSSIHPLEEVNALLSLFDGEIQLLERADEKGRKKVLQITKLFNQRYSDRELVLTREKLLDGIS